MNITSAAIEAFKNILNIEFVSNGNHIILRGTNGSGKSAVLDALMVAFFGKKLLPDDPILHGQESSKITFNIGNGEQQQFTIAVKIKSDDFNVVVTAYTPSGAKAKIGSPAAFLESIMLKDAADPQSFFAKSDKDQVQMLFDICPSLKPDLDKNLAEYNALKDQRSVTNAEGHRKDGELQNTPFTIGLPEKEVNPVELMEELRVANEHNNKLESVKNKLESTTESIDKIAPDIAEQEKRILSMQEQINLLTKNFDNEIASVSLKQKAQIKLKEEQLLLVKEMADFTIIPVEPINTKITECSTKNAQIRNNIKHKALTKEVEELRVKWNDGLIAMKKKEAERIDIIKAAKMPVDGLSIGDGCLMFPDPNTGELVRIKSLSTGQQWAVVIGILAAFLPAPEKGMRVLVVKNLNDLDEKNYLSMLEAANKHNIQLIMHQTVMRSDNSQCEIVIQDTLTKETT